MSYPEVWNISEMIALQIPKYVFLHGVNYLVLAERFDPEGQITFLFLKDGHPTVGVWQDNYPDLGVYTYILNACNSK